MIELARVEFRVHWAERAPERFLGRALNAWLYGEVARCDQRAADELHDAPGPRPFSAALVGEHDDLRLVLAGGPRVAPFLSDVADRTVRSGRILLDGHWLLVEGVAEAKTDTFADLLRRHLMRADRATPVRVDFLTPTAFHSRGRTMPLPIPDLVFGSLLERWRAFGGHDLGEAAFDVVRDCAAIRRVRIRSLSVRMEGRFTAFIGSAEFTLVNPPPIYNGLLGALAAFAEYAGVGQKTAMGFGCVRAAPLRPTRPADRQEPPDQEG
ncbi:CRISPR-associated endoribonuclease Cas6 [bacterium HR29]|jgi:CRISPR-associated endoribonuclease Cas6|nr:CRISPR-associated endoribonuclease Cas6 [bacterium HR29]